ncbi:DMT family transporter [Sphingorhabdus arenilitoris]|uniref:DMT family transporter n=1 Tax=Sphingorhabdus arenilitoris TaxID=1490041 RepID=A0ABV8RLL3_9SPHN
MNPWILLAVAIIFEIAGTSFLKASDGFTRWGIGAASIACYWVCFAFLALAITKIPVGVAYAIWSGAGILAIALIGWLIFKQNLSAVQMGCIALIIVGAVGLNMTTHTPDSAPKPQGQLDS